MKLSQDSMDWLEDITAAQMKALGELSQLVAEYMADEVLKCSVGRGEPTEERQLVYAKVRLEGSNKGMDLFLKQLQQIRKAADNRVAP
jgi:hypothetical protein